MQKSWKYINIKYRTDEKLEVVYSASKILGIYY